MTSTTLDAPKIRRERLPLVRRELKVIEKFCPTPNLIRVVLAGEELEGFLSPSPDDNIKIFITDEDGSSTMRSYTPRRYDAEKGELLLDFALHQAGPATQWAIDIQVGDTAHIGGPRGSKVLEGDVERLLLIGDDTALPAMARRVEEAEAGQAITMLASIPEAEDEQDIETPALFTPLWLHRNGAAPEDAEPFLKALETLDIPPGTFIWLAAEGQAVKAIRTYLMESRGVPRNWIKATGYWVKGKADTTAKFEE